MPKVKTKPEPEIKRLPYNYCPDCRCQMKILKTREGDPEGIRNDMKCSRCGSCYGCTKGGRIFLHNKHGSYIKAWKPLVNGDPPSFNIPSNWIRSTINLLRNSSDSGPGTLRILISLDNLLDQKAKEWRDERKRLVEAGEMAG